MKKQAHGLKVFAFFLLCVVGLFYLIVGTGKLHVKGSGYNVYIVFDDISGVEANAPVMLNGFEVGRIEDIAVSYEGNRTKNILKILLRKDIKIWNNPVISIKTLGLMGEKYIQITSVGGDEFIKAGQVLEGKPYVDFDTVIAQIDSLTLAVKQLALNLNQTVEGNQDRITQIVKNLEEFSDDLKRHPWKLLFKPRDTKSK